MERSFPDRHAKCLALTLTNCPCQGNHFDVRRSGASQGARARVGGRARRVHVVDEADRGRNAALRDYAPLDVAATGGEIEPALALERPRPPQHVGGGDPPPVAEGDRKGSWRHRAALARTLGVAGNVDEHLAPRSRHDLEHELSRGMRETTPTTLLPCPHERPGAFVVHDRGSRLHEAEAPAHALGTAAHRPRAG